MIIVKTVAELQKAKEKLNNNIGFVPTMGALHNGHISLIKESKKQNRYTIVSIFVNPTQFLEGEDLDKYPRQDKNDIKICELLDVDILFMPSKEILYSSNEPIIKAPLNKSYILEGYNRPSHFDGVLQIVLKLFNLVQPQKAYFGKKDAQQLYLIQNMVKKLFLPIEIIACETQRDSDGLALSSRNIYLTTENRNLALKLPKALIRAKNLIHNKKFDSNMIKSFMQDILQNIDIEYIEILDRDFNLIDEIKIGNTVIVAAIKIDNIRLIDNMWI